MTPTLADSTVMALMDSLRHVTHRADSLNSILQAYDATRNHWLAVLQTQTTIFSLITGGLLAILVAVNWGALNGHIKQASRAEARKLESKLDELASTLDRRVTRAVYAARKDSCLSVSMAALQRGDRAYALVCDLEAAVYFQLLDMPEEAIGSAQHIARTVDSYGDKVAIPRAEHARLLTLLSALDGRAGAKKTRDLIRKVLERVPLLPVEPNSEVKASRAGKSEK